MTSTITTTPTTAAGRLSQRLMDLWDEIPADEQALLAEVVGSDEVSGFERHQVTKEEYEKILAKMIADAKRNAQRLGSVQ